MEWLQHCKVLRLSFHSLIGWDLYCSNVCFQHRFQEASLRFCLLLLLLGEAQRINLLEQEAHITLFGRNKYMFYTYSIYLSMAIKPYSLQWLGVSCSNLQGFWERMGTEKDRAWIVTYSKWINVRLLILRYCKVRRNGELGCTLIGFNSQKAKKGIGGGDHYDKS